ncbi:MAG: MBL fold metallo-hydrolase [Chloroflexi bacterium]|uniref:MBL fold metallo-hydrolase n=1 Tax=Candidatus Chlorohelix allophototropha TaxID=3003348 RepID=A0A8T7M4I2_9CHLR|nr:MBL fold metallo-hydrolase [Chloroflexota bacterium]WJW70029.1 MBL fold metallo-hydrolase [Chloroflexota bacterium L227-S17]
MYFKQFKLEGMGCASYLIGSTKSGEAAVIDPAWEIEQYLEEAAAQNLKITQIYETHLHADHVSGNRRLAAITGARIYLHKIADAAFPYVAVEGGTEIKLGELNLKVLHTPGHTWESINLLVEDTSTPNFPPHLLSGDTLFVGDVGRPDFAGQEGAGTLFDSIQREILPLPDNTEVYPAHLAGSLCGRSLSTATVSSIGYEKKTNPALQIFDRNRFVDFLTADLPPAPPDFKRIVGLNRAGSPEVQTRLTELKWEEVQAKIQTGAKLLDIREPEQYWKEHLPGSQSVPLGLSQFGATAAMFVLPENPIIMVAADLAAIQAAQNGLGVVGRYNVAGYVLFDKVAEQAQSGLHKRLLGEELASKLTDDTPIILDVREPGEFAVDGLFGALNIPLRKLPVQLSQIEQTRDKLVVVLCASGYRSSVATSYLENQGWKMARNLKGGMDAMNALKVKQPV